MSSERISVRQAGTAARSVSTKGIEAAKVPSWNEPFFQLQSDTGRRFLQLFDAVGRRAAPARLPTCTATPLALSCRAMRARPSRFSPLLCAVVLLATTAHAQTALQTYSVNPSTVTISGISSGGFMAVQMHVAYSSAHPRRGDLRGRPLLLRAGDSESTALGACDSGSGLTLSTFTDYTASEASAGDHRSPSNLSGQPVYLFSGTGDTTVAPGGR